MNYLIVIIFLNEIILLIEIIKDRVLFIVKMKYFI